MVEQIIAIDSNSTDGTFEMLQERLSVFKAQVISTSPGLYKAWNLGVSKATQPYVYFSTIGDILKQDALNRMCQLIQSEEFDVLISPPRIVNELGEAIDKRWPIHDLRDLLSDNREMVPTSDELLVLSTLYIPESIIGSSASNLYRRDILKKSPFPEDVGMIGDVIWALNNLFSLKVCICGSIFATFCFDGDRNVSWEKTYRIVNSISSHISDLINKNIWPKNINTLAIERNIKKQAKILENISKLDNWISWIFCSRFNRFKINVIDSFSIREQWKKIFSSKVP
jgi:hypothetical protein